MSDLTDTRHIRGALKQLMFDFVTYKHELDALGLIRSIEVRKIDYDGLHFLNVIL